MARLDNALVERGFFKTRTKAQEAIAEGKIFCDRKKVEKPSHKVEEHTLIEIRGEIIAYVSRGALKLEKAASSFGVDFSDKTVLDIGSSTGGFTDYMLKHGASKVIAVDVGTEQMDKDLRLDPRIDLHEQTDFRVVSEKIVEGVEIACIDISFISVEKILPRLFEIKSLKEVVCLIKPQFECNKEIAAKYKGIILNKEIHHEIIERIIEEFQKYNLGCLGLIFSPITGGSGNIEYLAYFKKNYNPKQIYINLIVEQGFEKFHIKS